MDEMDRDNGPDFEDEEDEFQDIVYENMILWQAVTNLLVKKGILTREEIEAAAIEIEKELGYGEDEE